MIGTTVSGKSVRVFGLTKRKHTGYCELCNSQETTVYHHWDDSNLNKGVWTCRKHHHLCELTDELARKGVVEMVDKYLELKSQIEEGTL